MRNNFLKHFRETFYIADESGYNVMDRRKSILSKNANLFPGINTNTKNYIEISMFWLNSDILLQKIL